MAEARYDVETLLQEVIQLESRVGAMQTERLDLEQRVLVAQQRQAQHMRPHADPEAVEKMAETRLRRQLENVRAQITAKETEMAELLERDPRAALVVQVQQGVDKYVGESRRLRRALHEQKALVQLGPRPASKLPTAELEVTQLRTQLQEAQKEIAALREQTDALNSEAVRWEEQQGELSGALKREDEHAGGPVGSHAEGERAIRAALAELDASEALAEQRHAVQLDELRAENEALEAKLEEVTRQMSVLREGMPHYAALNAAGA